MEQLTEINAEDYITSHMVSFLAQSRPFGGVKSANGLCSFFSENVSIEQRDLILNTYVPFDDRVIAHLKKNWRASNQSQEVRWFVVLNWNIRLFIFDEVNRSQYTDILKPGDPITIAVVKKAKADNEYYDLGSLAVQHVNERISIHN